MIKKIAILISLLLFIVSTFAQSSKHSRTSKFKSYKGLVMAGYQGWFNAPEDGAGRGWYHYRQRGEFAPGNTKVDMWPETKELEKVYKTAFKHADSSPAYLPSSNDA